jgi:hypothetical protein
MAIWGEGIPGLTAGLFPHIVRGATITAAQLGKISLTVPGLHLHNLTSPFRHSFFPGSYDVIKTE